MSNFNNNTKPDNPYVHLVPPPTAPQALYDHSNLFAKKIFPVGDTSETTKGCVYVYVGWNLANITIVVIPNEGIVVVDTGEDKAQMEAVWTDFHDESNTTIPAAYKALPLVGIILTHHHADHVNGTSVILDDNNPVPIVGADNLNAEFMQENGLIAPLMSCRAMAQYNNLLLKLYPEEVAGLNSGIGPIITQGPVGYRKPTLLISTTQGNKINTIDFGTSLKFEIVYVPSEANSEIAIYLKGTGILLSAEVIQDHSFPNLYTLRGASFRDPSDWAAAIDTFLTHFPEATDMVLQHGPPITQNNYEGNTISEILIRYHDAIQYVHDQTLRWALKGYAKEEIMHLVKLPENQATYSPWLQEFYGTVKHSVPAVYTGYIGWFDGDPIALDPTPRSTFSGRMIEMMGGQDRVFAIANEIYLKAASKNQAEAIADWQFAAELATLIIRRYPLLNLEDNPEQLLSEKLQSVKSGLQGKLEEFQEKIEDIKSGIHDKIESLKSGKHDDPKSEKHGETEHNKSGCKHHPSLLHREEGDNIWWQARYLKAACFRQLAYRTICANWRGTYLTAAHELEGVPLVAQITAGLRLGTSLTAGGVAISQSILELAVRLKAEVAETAPTYKIGLKVTDAKDGDPAAYTLSIRNCVLISKQHLPIAPESTEVTIEASTETINILLGGDGIGGFNAILENKNPKHTVTYSGNPTTSAEKSILFFSFFDEGRFTKAPNIYVH